MGQTTTGNAQVAEADESVMPSTFTDVVKTLYIHTHLLGMAIDQIPDYTTLSKKV